MLRFKYTIFQINKIAQSNYRNSRPILNAHITCAILLHHLKALHLRPMKMMKFWTLAVLLLSTAFAKAQILINELDADTQSTDTQEFIELKTDTPFQSLDGYIMVLFNGSSSTTTGEGRAYFVEDLDGLTSDENGLVLIGMPRVSPVPQRIFFNDNFQNGADAVGIYIGEPADFPEGNSFATTTNLIDALVYETSDATGTDIVFKLYHVQSPLKT